MQFLKQWWPVFASTLVLLMGALMLTAESVFLQDADLRDPNALAWRNPYVAVQIVLTGISVFGAWRSEVNRYVLVLITALDSLLGLGLTAYGWLMLDKLATTG